jgi:hypothetical protein
MLPGDEVREAKGRLQILLKCANEEGLTKHGLRGALNVVVKASRPKEEESNGCSIVCSLILKTARAGFAAATVAQTDPVLSDSVGDLGRSKSAATCVFEKAIMAAPRRTHEDGLAATPKHPLPRLARELYPECSLEGRTIMEFLEHHLKTLGIVKEEQCPGGELDLLDWVAAALEHGRSVKAEKPELVAEILQECAGQRLEGSRTVIEDVVTKAKRIEPLSLIRPMLEWYRNVHHAEDPFFYGQHVARVGCIADFAVWIPWLSE